MSRRRKESPKVKEMQISQNLLKNFIVSIAPKVYNHPLCPDFKVFVKGKVISP